MFEEWGVEKFDLILGNPPYNTEQRGDGKKTHPLWNLFVEKSFTILQENGYLVMVHPSGWRNVDGAFKKVQNLLKERQMLYININNYKKGFETFGAYTDYDYYCLKNTLNINNLTKIVDIDDKIVEINISGLPFIPKCNIIETISLIAKNDEEKVNILYTLKYHTQRPHMNKIQNDTFKYPCVQNINNKDDVACVWYSNINESGHFNIPKVIFGSKNCGVYCDENGEYAMAQHCAGIIDDVKNFENIKKALKNKYFIKNIMGFRESFGDKYNRKIISTFRKDFWKEFIKK